jgi:hypothetical protein
MLTDVAIKIALGAGETMSPTHGERRAALLMVRTHGLAAQRRAMFLAKERHREGDDAGWALWRRIHGAIDDLRHTAGRPLPKTSGPW